jgi:hypothetical protein
MLLDILWWFKMSLFQWSLCSWTQKSHGAKLGEQGGCPIRKMFLHQKLPQILSVRWCTYLTPSHTFSTSFHHAVELWGKTHNCHFVFENKSWVDSSLFVKKYDNINEEVWFIFSFFWKVIANLFSPQSWVISQVFWHHHSTDPFRFHVGG